MALRSGYCGTEDLVLGELPLPPYIDPVKAVADAADEIDSKIGFVYLVPIDISGSSTVAIPVKLLLKRINLSLASGRIILALDVAGENKNLNAYGQSLVKDALEALLAIAAGNPPLPGVSPAEGAIPPVVSAPLISNLDKESSVEAFYDRIGNPKYYYPGQYGGPYGNYDRWTPVDDGRLVR